MAVNEHNAEPPQFVLVLAGTQFNLSEAWLFFAFQPCFTYSANLDSNGLDPTVQDQISMMIQGWSPGDTSSISVSVRSKKRSSTRSSLTLSRGTYVREGCF